ncbi:MAG: fibronectin type III domain-containing protein [Isosphaeraceae bacterium]
MSSPRIPRETPPRALPALPPRCPPHRLVWGWPPSLAARSTWRGPIIRRQRHTTTWSSRPTGPPGTQIASLYGTSTNSYTVTGPFNGSTTYYFRVHAYAYTGGNSAYATASVTTPAFPNQPSLTSASAQSDTSVSLSWTDAAGETGFLVERSTSNGTTWTTAASVGTGVTSLTDTRLAESTSYTYRVSATNSASSSAPSATRSVATQPSAPSGLAATAVSATQINLVWTDHSTAASTYYVERSTDGVNWTQVGTVYGTTAASYTATGPFKGSTTYDFRVRDYSYTGGYSAYAPLASTTTPAFPNQPTISSAVAQSDTSVLLSWADVAGETGFRIERQVSGIWTSVGTVGAGVTTFTDTGLHEATSYNYRVFATNSLGDSAPSATAYATTLPAAPTGLVATAVAWNQINLSWTDHSSAAYYYYVDQSADGANWTRIGSIYGTTANSYTATGPFNGPTPYYCRVQASAGSSSTFATTSVTTAFPATPTLSTATALSDTSIALSWSDVAGETGFRIERQISGTWTSVGTVGAGVTSYTDTGLTEATSYAYRLFATNSIGDSAPSGSQSATTLPAAPSGLMASAVAWNQINLSWTDHSSLASYYYVEQSPDGSTWTQIAMLYGSTVTSYSVTGPFDAATTYYFRVCAYAYTGGYSTYATTSVTTAFPATPTINSAIAQSDTSIALTWSDVPNETGFRVERSADNGTTWATAGAIGTGVTSFTDTGLTECTSYTYRVFATNSFGDSAPSATASATTLPAAPTGLTLTAVSASEIDLSWTDQSTGATGYSVEQSTDGVNWTVVGSLSSTASSYTATGPFSPSTTYYFAVYASGAGGDSRAFFGSIAHRSPGAPGDGRSIWSAQRTLRYLISAQADCKPL